MVSSVKCGEGIASPGRERSSEPPAVLAVLRVLGEGRESEMPAQVVLVGTLVVTNEIVRAASPPTLAKNARMGHPLWNDADKRRQRRATRLTNGVQVWKGHCKPAALNHGFCLRLLGVDRSE